MQPEVSGLEIYQKAIADQKPTCVVGADEVGYGAWAGSVLVCAVLVPVGWNLYGLNDSKKLTKAKIEDVYQRLMMSKVPYSVKWAGVEEIDRDGLGVALRRCFVDAVTELNTQEHTLIVLDGEVQIPGVSYIHFPRADGIVPAVMAASVIAKRTRDKMMVDLAGKYPGYGLGDHSGYGTPKHEEALRLKGKSPEHRKYTPMARILTGKRGSKVVEFEDDRVQEAPLGHLRDV